jgi:hypothetical protein
MMITHEIQQSPADVAARGCLEGLLSSFPGPSRRSLASSIPKSFGYPLIGLEVEVKWSSFFPELAARFFRDGRTYMDLNPDEIRCLTEAMKEVEGAVYDKLNAGLEAGLLRGRDRWWEHVLPATTEPQVAIEILNCMTDSGLLPQGQHALHLTVGTVKHSRDLYFALLAMELIGSDRDRILSGFHRTHENLVAGWAKKGRAGIFVKKDWDLKHEPEAVELRTVFLDNRDQGFETLLTIAYKACKGVADIQHGVESNQTHAFRIFRDAAHVQLQAHGLPDCNWEKPHQNPDVWRKFADAIASIKQGLQEELLELSTS